MKQCIDSFRSKEELFSYHYIKDAAIFLTHSIEVLLKYILSSSNESLIFKDLKIYKDAKRDLLNKINDPVKIENGFGYYPCSKHTIFDVEKGKKLETINLNESIERVRYFCDIEMSEEFIGSIHYIKDYRNKIMHHSIKLYSHEIDIYINKLEFLYDEALSFFEKHILGLTEKVDSHRYEINRKEWEEIQREMQDYYHERVMSKIL